MVHIFKDDPQFNGDIAMIGNGEAQVALLKLPETVTPLSGSREQKGHTAFKVSVESFWEYHTALPRLLQSHRVHSGQSIDFEEADYGRQLSLFFYDPDANEVGWTRRALELRCGGSLRSSTDDNGSLSRQSCVT